MLNRFDCEIDVEVGPRFSRPQKWYGTACGSKRVNFSVRTRSLALPVLYLSSAKAGSASVNNEILGRRVSRSAPGYFISRLQREDRALPYGRASAPFRTR